MEVNYNFFQTTEGLIYETKTASAVVPEVKHALDTSLSSTQVLIVRTCLPLRDAGIISLWYLPLVSNITSILSCLYHFLGEMLESAEIDIPKKPSLQTVRYSTSEQAILYLAPSSVSTERILIGSCLSNAFPYALHEFRSHLSNSITSPDVLK
jgi:hypothetical protein